MRTLAALRGTAVLVAFLELVLGALTRKASTSGNGGGIRVSVSFKRRNNGRPLDGTNLEFKSLVSAVRQ